MPRKIDPVLLGRLKEAGYGVSAIARKFKVGKASVSKALRKIDQTAFGPQKPRMMERLESLADQLEDEIGFIKQMREGCEGAEWRQWSGLALRHYGELRRMIKELRDTALVVYNLEQVERFKQIVLQAIGAVDPEIRLKIMERIKLYQEAESTSEKLEISNQV